ncbi:hypothetical protein AAGS40_18230 [Paraburkholderia sp. PREW-6R]|uniref:hypothetical protein n=1 Tax=Paraburkholderia sp. PREW-6R TaxID=3141544 RepID=UPI0031F4F7A6
MFTFIFVVAVAAFIPYVATPGIANGVKAIAQPHQAMIDEPMSTPTAPATAGDDAINRLVSAPRERDTSV